MFRQILPILTLFISTAFLMAGSGMQAILLPVRGQLEGFTASQIGLIGGGWAVGFTIGCIAVPHLVRRVGHVRTFSALAALLATTVLLNGLVIEAYTWVVLRALAGLCLSGTYMIIESWLNEKISNETRGAIFSVYMIISQGAYMCGQYILVMADPARETLFMIAAILYALAVVPTALSKAQSPAPLNQSKIDFRGLYKNSPASVVGAVTAGVIAGAFQSFAPVFGVQNSMSSTNIANMMVLVLIGAILFQYPLGKLSDRMDRRYVMVGLSLTGALSCFLIAGYQVNGAAPGIPFFALMVLLGGFIYPIYGLVMAHANDYADAEDFVKTASGLLILYGGGNVIGPMVTGPIMEQFGPNSLFQVIGVAHFVLALYITYRMLARARPDDLETMDFQTLSVGQTTETFTLDPRSDAETYLSGENDS